MTDRTPSRGLPWTAEGDAELRRRVAAKERPAQIAIAMGRPIEGIRGRAQVLGLTFAPRINPWREHMTPRRVQLLRERAARDNDNGEKEQ